MREKQHSQIITSTPFKDDLEKKEQKKNEKARNAAKKNIAKKSRKTNKKLKRKRTKLPDSDSETSSFDEKEIGDDDDLDNMSDVSEHEKCVICGDIGKNREMWFRCTICGYWAHMACTDCDSAEGFVCDSCRS
ncbi:PHD finger protein ALFIN-LIKE 4-like [Sitophilus oryzae]|uniref:PHD finger protein ALFIN-LIKE 4-like n=1 Tax=Sitophilus oryzae TaxID=7048 RepID=A0A6J2XN29_SITOR|nr:PHD finger protein ALFIN-LIKE 4-like [Sitophilus oryzae]